MKANRILVQDRHGLIACPECLVGVLLPSWECSGCDESTEPHTHRFCNRCDGRTPANLDDVLGKLAETRKGARA